MDIHELSAPTPLEIQQLRYALGMTQTAFGQWLRSSMRTVQQWEGGLRAMPTPVWELALLKAGRIPLVIAPAKVPGTAHTTDAHAGLL